jgi:hypothetical protein
MHHIDHYSCYCSTVGGYSHSCTYCRIAPGGNTALEEGIIAGQYCCTQWVHIVVVDVEECCDEMCVGMWVDS